MKPLFEQLGGTCRKESDQDIPNLEMPDTENFEMDIYEQRHLYFLQHYRREPTLICLQAGIADYQLRRKPVYLQSG